MKRKPRSSGGANWMDTYGDMVTLLLCFFVLLYSMSSISEDKWRAIVMSFNPNAVETPTENSGNDGPIADPTDPSGSTTEPTMPTPPNLSQLYEAMKDYVTENALGESISVTQGDGKVFLTFKDMIFFDGDSSRLRSEAYPVLDRVCELLSSSVEEIGEVRVIGHTAQGIPGRPNDVEYDRTLSSDRAARVIVYVQQHSLLEPSRLISEGAGQWRPIATNETFEGRSQNRRVEFIISGRTMSGEIGGDIVQYDDSPSEG